MISTQLEFEEKCLAVIKDISYSKQVKKYAVLLDFSQWTFPLNQWGFHLFQGILNFQYGSKMFLQKSNRQTSCEKFFPFSQFVLQEQALRFRVYRYYLLNYAALRQLRMDPDYSISAIISSGINSAKNRSLFLLNYWEIVRKRGK